MDPLLLFLAFTLLMWTGFVAILLAPTRPAKVVTKTEYKVPPELERLAKAFGITSDVDNSKSYGRMIHDYIEALKIDHDKEIADLKAQIAEQPKPAVRYRFVSPLHSFDFSRKVEGDLWYDQFGVDTVRVWEYTNYEWVPRHDLGHRFAGKDPGIWRRVS